MLNRRTLIGAISAGILALPALACGQAISESRGFTVDRSEEPCEFCGLEDTTDHNYMLVSSPEGEFRYCNVVWQRFLKGSVQGEFKPKDMENGKN